MKALLARLKPAIAASKLPKAKLAQAQHLASDAEEILAMLGRDGSSGVHAPAFTLAKVNEAKLLAQGALELLGAKAEPGKVSMK